MECSYTAQNWPSSWAYRVFLLIAKTTKTRTLAVMSKTFQAARKMSSILASVSCLLASQVWHRGRQVKFLSKKSSLQVRLVNSFNEGSVADPIMADKPIYSGIQELTQKRWFISISILRIIIFTNYACACTHYSSQSAEQREKTLTECTLFTTLIREIQMGVVALVEIIDFRLAHTLRLQWL